MSPTDTKASSLHQPLLAWFEREQRALPWRETRDPYRVWISEAMLQQTRVETVIPYYRRFLERFPDVRTLAAAPIEDVLAQWSGLGYYRRARTLHAAAQAVVSEHAGLFPASHAALLALPGIGPYTAGAVASIAFDEPAALVDGNVARVLARLFALDGPQESQAFRTATWAIARELVASVSRPGAWNQALMELGATVCTPRDPACYRCPVRTGCSAALTNRVDELPRAKVRRTQIEVELLVLVVHENGGILLRERPPGGRMAGLIELPTIETSGDELIAARTWGGGLEFTEIEPLGAVRHTITHHKIGARVAAGRLVRGHPGATWRRVEVSELGTLALTGMTKKIAARGWLEPDAALKRRALNGI
ncbi:MAG: A/G-specific adenine glycosylase [Planctomycetes bacterium]|nr:A/G-specific adenine glycosylase [Planctomycetota bacterium]